MFPAEYGGMDTVQHSYYRSHYGAGEGGALEPHRGCGGGHTQGQVELLHQSQVELGIAAI